jgi:hypothetical protein
VKDDTVSEEGLGESPELDLERPEEEGADSVTGPAEGQDPDPITGEAEGEDPDPVPSDSEGVDPDQPAGSGARSSRRRVAFAATRAAAVLVVAAVGYQLVVPQSHVVRSRLSRLVLSQPGVATFKVKSPQAAEVPASGTQLTTVVAASERSPNQTGGYTISWSPSTTLGSGVLVFLLPSTAQAAATLPAVRAQQAAAGTYTTQGLTRHATFTVAGVPGSAGASYTPTSKSSASPGDLSIATFRYGRVVAAVEVVAPASTQADTNTIAAREYGLLRRVEPGFTMTKITRPVLASSLWIAGALLVAAIAALAPAGRRRLAERRQRRIDEELSHQVVVRGQTIAKHRR